VCARTIPFRQWPNMTNQVPDVVGGLPQFKFFMEYGPGEGRKVTSDGSGTESNVTKLPIAENLAGVSMRLNPGALRELHWHANAAEWGYCVRGGVRITAMDLDGRWEIADCDEGDAFFFPRGLGHSIQGLGPEESHFILIFDNGHFSEFGTFSSTDWIGHSPAHVLGTNFGVSADTFAKFPKSEQWIVPGPVPAPISENVGNPHPVRFVYRMSAMEAQHFPGGSLKLVTANEFPMSNTMCGAVMTLQPGALRELHWHPAVDEWQYVIAGKLRVGLFGSGGRYRIEDLIVGDSAYIPSGYGHHIENTGDTDATMLFGFNSGFHHSVSASDWFGKNSTQLLATNFGVPESTFSKMTFGNKFIRSRLP